MIGDSAGLSGLVGGGPMAVGLLLGAITGAVAGWIARDDGAPAAILGLGGGLGALIGAASAPWIAEASALQILLAPVFGGLALAAALTDGALRLLADRTTLALALFGALAALMQEALGLRLAVALFGMALLALLGWALDRTRRGASAEAARAVGAGDPLLLGVLLLWLHPLDAALLPALAGLLALAHAGALAVAARLRGPGWGDGVVSFGPSLTAGAWLLWLGLAA